MKKHRTAGRFAALIAATALLIPAGSVHAEPPGDDDRPVPPAAGVTLDEVQRQQALDEALGDLWKLVPNDGANAPGFASVTVDRDEGRVAIYWRGDVPNGIRALETSAHADVTVIPASFSQSDSDRAADYIFGLAREGQIPLPVSVGLNAAADELQVLFAATDLSKVNIDELTAATESMAGVKPTFLGTTRSFVGASR